MRGVRRLNRLRRAIHVGNLAFILLDATTLTRRRLAIAERRGRPINFLANDEIIFFWTRRLPIEIGRSRAFGRLIEWRFNWNIVFRIVADRAIRKILNDIDRFVLCSEIVSKSFRIIVLSASFSRSTRELKQPEERTSSPR